MNPLHAQTIASPQNPRVKEWAGLLDKKNRERSGRFLIEGVHLVMEALKAGAQLDAVVFDTERGWPSELTPWTKDVPNLEIFAASPAVMAKCSDTDTVPPVFAIAAKPAVEPASLYRDGALVVVLDGLRDPGNVGTIIRTADAFGAVGVVAVAGTVDAASPKVVRSSAGSVFHIPVCQVASFADARALIHGRSAALLGTSGGAGSLSLSDLLVQGVSARSRLSQSHAWVFGNEARGLSGDEMRLCDALVSIPMSGDAESLNVASAAATCLFASQTVRGRQS